MKQFENFWNEFLAALDTKRKIRNWTTDKRYSLGGWFIAQSWRSAEGAWDRSRPGLPIDARESIICTQLREQGSVFVEKYHAEFCYRIWPTYGANGITRKLFDEGGHANSYLISLFKEFEDLTKDPNRAGSGLQF
ncbi:MAG TPA: hypothetical protein VG028_01505 [Terriglobia bacterium]|nr:hypothetical protein [Terriglobia bacterium]